MAKKNKVNNRSATQRDMTFLVPFNRLEDGENPPRSFIDIAACLSLTNSRHYEQGRNYRVKVTLLPTASQRLIGGPTPLGLKDMVYDQKLQVASIGNNWATHAAWQLAKDAYDASRKSELAMGTVNSKYEDFAVAMTDAHALLDTNNAAVPNWNWGRGLTPLKWGRISTGDMQPFSATPPTGTDLVFSRVHAQAGTAERRFLFSTAAGSTDYNMLTELNKSRSIVSNKQEPVGSATGLAYDQLDANSDAATQGYIEADGDEAPYEIGEHNIGVTYHELHQYAQAGYARSTTGYFDAPCGLLTLTATELDFDGESDGTFTDMLVKIEVQEGTYKGVHAPKMGFE